MALSQETYHNIYHIPDTTKASLDDLSNLIDTYPVIDNHAHNILREDEAENYKAYPFEAITSEATGHALHDHVHTSLSHIKACRQLAKFYGCASTVEDIKTARSEWVQRDYAGLVKKCLVGTHALLIDDGLPQDDVYSINYHKQFAPTVARIVRIESVAAELLRNLVQAAGLLAPGVDASWNIEKAGAVLSRFSTAFRNQIRSLTADPSVKGFKSVVCYRSGLDVSLVSRSSLRPQHVLSESPLLTSFNELLKTCIRNDDYRIQQKQVNDFLVVATCDVLSKLVETQGENLPFQFHTGLGDNDIDLIKSNPAYLQPLVAAFPHVDFVILHSSYPYTREAGYLATTYSNVWLDIGEVFPMLARHGQKAVLREALECTPGSKILWSTDGHFHPETFLLANQQFRQVLKEVLLELIMAEDISIMQAVALATDIMFWNSNSLYRLEEYDKYPQLAAACGRPVRDDDHNSETTSSIQPSGQTLTFQSATPYRGDMLLGQSTTDISTQQAQSDTTLLNKFLAQHKDIKYIHLEFISYDNTIRTRMVPVKAFREQLNNRSFLGITKALPRLLANEWPAQGTIATGEFKIVPDLATLTLNAGLSSPSATVSTSWHDPISTPYSRCPRSLLDRITTSLSTNHGLTMMFGFEIEVTFFRPSPSTSNPASYLPLTTIHSWSNLTDQQLPILPMIEEIVSLLSETGIDIPHFHAETANGQWEFPLPPASPLQAVDMLYRARVLIQRVAYNHGLRASFYPRPFVDQAGTACHAHFSINPPPNTTLDPKLEENFLAGILTELSAICAFSLPTEVSYERIKPGIWAGGEWICWGTQNREVPLRKVDTGHFELRCIDGMANMYLAMAALVAAGLLGIKNNMHLAIKEVHIAVADMTDKDREDIGVVNRLPRTLDSAIEKLEQSEALKDMLGREVVEDYVAVRRFMAKTLQDMGEEEARKWLMARF